MRCEALQKLPLAIGESRKESHNLRHSHRRSLNIASICLLIRSLIYTSFRHFYLLLTPLQRTYIAHIIHHVWRKLVDRIRGHSQ